MRPIDFHAYAVDPGQTSGVAILNRKGRFMGIQLGFEDIYDDLVSTIQACAMMREPLIVACEREIIRPDYIKQDRGVDNWPMEVIGVLKILTIKNELPLLQYASADSKNFAPDDTLKTLGFHTPGKQHANDAARVLCMTLAERDTGYWKQIVRESGLLYGDN